MTINYCTKEDKYWIKDGDQTLVFASLLKAKDTLREIEVREAVDAATAPLMIQINALNDALAWATAEIARMEEKE